MPTAKPVQVIDEDENDAEDDAEVHAAMIIEDDQSSIDCYKGGTSGIVMSEDIEVNGTEGQSIDLSVQSLTGDLDVVVSGFEEFKEPALL